MRPLIAPMPGNDVIARKLGEVIDAELASIEHRRFPDRESYVRILSDVRDRDVFLISTLDRPDEKLVPLSFAAGALRDMGARKITLVAPYLAYMRQDTRFHAGEAISAAYFAALISTFVDGVITVDPHLHRLSGLNAIYSVPTRVVAASAAIARWVRSTVKDPILVGPDSESEQWVADVAAQAGTPYVVLSKRRRGDRSVEITAPSLVGYSGMTPIIIDDIASSGRTMIAAARLLREQGFAAPSCVVTHAVFAPGGYEELLAETERVVSTDTIPHVSNGISVARDLGLIVQDFIHRV